MRDRVASRIAVDGEIEDEELLKEFLEKKKQKKVEFIHPQKGEHLSIVNMCISNANEHLAQQQGRLGREIATLEELKNLLGLDKCLNILSLTIFRILSVRIMLQVWLYFTTADR